MIKKVAELIKKNNQIFSLVALALITIIATSHHNYTKKVQENNLDELFSNLYFNKTVNHIFNNLEPKFKIITHKIKAGETFRKILENYSVNTRDISQIQKIISNKININKLNLKKKIYLTIDQENNKVIEFIYPISKTKQIKLSRNLNSSQFNEKIIETKLSKKIIYAEDLILQSVYKSASKQKVPANIIIEFARIYGFQVDFQRDIRKKDSFQIMYEIFLNDDKKIIETGEILFANLNLSGVDNLLYYFGKKNVEGHYDETGKSSKKALMKTPINGARLSSPFGMRKHPIDGFNKMHRGTDFAAPMGTPIMASGDGVIKKVGWCGGGGNCIKIKHNSTYQTIYAHMSKFAPGIKVGVRVKQGQVIGFVGSTGKSTGPHLHYEVIEYGKKINSQTLKLPSGKILKGKEREIFETQKIKLNVLRSEKIMGLN